MERPHWWMRDDLAGVRTCGDAAGAAWDHVAMILSFIFSWNTSSSAWCWRVATTRTLAGRGLQRADIRADQLWGRSPAGHCRHRTGVLLTLLMQKKIAAA